MRETNIPTIQCEEQNKLTTSLTLNPTPPGHDHTLRAIFSCHFFAYALLHIPFLRNLDTSSYLHFLLHTQYLTNEKTMAGVNPVTAWIKSCMETYKGREEWFENRIAE